MRAVITITEKTTYTQTHTHTGTHSHSHARKLECRGRPMVSSASARFCWLCCGCLRVPVCLLILCGIGVCVWLFYCSCGGDAYVCKWCDVRRCATDVNTDSCCRQRAVLNVADTSTVWNFVGFVFCCCSYKCRICFNYSNFKIQNINYSIYYTWLLTLKTPDVGLERGPRECLP